MMGWMPFFFFFSFSLSLSLPHDEVRHHVVHKHPPHVAYVSKHGVPVLRPRDQHAVLRRSHVVVVVVVDGTGVRVRDDSRIVMVVVSTVIMTRRPSPPHAAGPTACACASATDATAAHPVCLSPGETRSSRGALCGPTAASLRVRL